MPKKIANPYADDPGFDRGKQCTRPIGGWIIIYDADKSDWMESPLRWVLMHPESQAATCFKYRNQAAKEMDRVAKDGGGFLTEAEKRFKEAPRKAATKKQARPPAKKKAAACKKTAKPATKRGKTARKQGKTARTSKASVVEGEVIPPKNGQSQSLPARAHASNENEISQNLLEHLETTFPNEVLTKHIEKMLEAEITYTTKDGGSYEKPDQPTRLKAIELILKYKIGNPRMRNEIEIKSQMSLNELENMATRSPIFRKALLEVVDRLGLEG